MKMAKQEKRRSWGKARNKEKIAIVDQMEVDVLVKEIGSVDKLNTDATCTATHSIDFQHPEIMNSESLVAILSRMRVPIPVYQDGKPSRERMIYLFKKHVTPRPQRDTYWRQLGRRRKRRRGQDTPMEVDDTCSTAGDWALDSDGGWAETPVQRKRKLQDNDEVTSPPKRVPFHIPCQSFSEIKVVDDEPKHNLPSTAACEVSSPPSLDPPRRVIKVKRPSKEGGGGEGGVEKTARTAGGVSWTSKGSGKSSSEGLNGKSRPETVPAEGMSRSTVQPSLREKITWP